MDHSLRDTSEVEVEHIIFLGGVSLAPKKYMTIVDEHYFPNACLFVTCSGWIGVEFRAATGAASKITTNSGNIDWTSNDLG